MKRVASVCEADAEVRKRKRSVCILRRNAAMIVTRYTWHVFGKRVGFALGGFRPTPGCDMRVFGWRDTP